MKKVKILILAIFMPFILTGCFNKERPISNNLTDNISVKSKQSSVKTITIKPSNVKAVTIKPKDAQIKEINGFVLLSSLDKDIVIDLKYATTDNFTKKIIYPNKVCVLRKTTAQKLVKANTELKKLGYEIKVWDAYRPIYVQQIFWNMVKDSRFVANPNNGGSIHNKGCAVDVTLVDKNGNELNMGSKFDDFSSKAYRTNSNKTIQAKKNIDLLTKYMVNNGFTTIDTEWWHFDDVDSKNYKIADIDLKLFLK